ncbi:hypothetical protein FACS1894139_05090 [Planctomycetales bacterium]|nr:hypothetical protein FACS1894107_03170 [Planctomycetales bacterium]GHS97070.1 hypothetical protein FACS1894108_02830 [Planctomycetales bacterium]GHT03863.1 hypothetical protein FACS1894139_05090 [Planctomycetales bacterium]
MFFSINRSHNLAGQRGSAIIETLLLVPVALIIFTLAHWMLNYWQNVHFDKDTRLASEVARRNSTNIKPKNYAGIGLKTKDVSDTIYGGYENGLTKHQITITKTIDTHWTRQTRELAKITMFRGINSWLSYPYLRGQFDAVWSGKGEGVGDEGGRRVEWFGNVGADKFEETIGGIDGRLRVALQLGS